MGHTIMKNNATKAKIRLYIRCKPRIYCLPKYAYVRYDIRN